MSMRDLITTFTEPTALKTALENLNRNFSNAPNPNDRCYYSALGIKRLMAVHYYVQRCITVNKIPDIRFIDIDKAVAYFQSRRPKDDNDDDDATKLTIPKFTGNNWIDFRDKLMHHLRNTIGHRAVTLDYVLRFDDGNQAGGLEEEAFPDLDSSDVFSKYTTLSGPLFQLDNERTYQILKTHLLGTPGYNYIQRFNARKNGRSAWVSLTSHYEGSSFKEVIRQKAFTNLRNTFYKGERDTFNFEKYVSIHKEAHRWLEEIEYGDQGTGMDTVSKVQFFIDGIKPKSGLDTEMRLLTSRPDLKSNFDLLANYLGQALHANSARYDHHNQTSYRNVSACQGSHHGHGNSNSNRYQPYYRGNSSYSGNYSRGGRGFRGRGRGRGYGRGGYGRGGYGRGGFGRGRGHQSQSDHNRNNGKYIDGKFIYAKRYSSEEYANLTQAQKQYLYELRNKSTDTNETDNTTQVSDMSSSLQQDFNSMRNQINTLQDAIINGVAQAATDNSAPNTVVTPPNQGQNRNNNNTDESTRITITNGQAGNAFGRRNRNQNQA